MAATNGLPGNAGPAEGTLGEVRAQYEQLPYPARDPADESRRLITTWLDDLPMINHYCFAGRESFRDGFRVLVAGAGTGDATIFLAHQLRETDARIVHLDLSEASIGIARRRAEVRGLGNITWVHDSLLNLPSLGLGPFDYIQCAGVLHHLEDPDAGLRALESARKERGALGLMVYGRHGRTGVYQMQEMLRLLDGGGEAAQPRIERTKEVLAHLPGSNWFKRGEDLYWDHKAGDAGIFDLLLHARDRAYTVGELYDWLQDGHGYDLRFTEVGSGPSAYDPAAILGPRRPAFLERLAALPLRRRQEFAELLGGRLVMHALFAVRPGQEMAAYGEPDYVPFLFHEPVTGPDLARLVEQNRKPTLLLQHAHTGLALPIAVGKYSKYILNNMDGARTFGEIFDIVRDIPKFTAAPPTNGELFEDFRPFFDALRSIDRILLRHRS
ncbi:MAG: class I SAM-dependent methyltransferase, partial [Rhodocyclaceae bacterium]|nr:class I SAM-dependent methyltransferase [Rhodocyclaceae bacterium]